MKKSFTWSLPLLCGCGLLAAFCLPSTAARADEASKLALINEMFEVTHADALLQETYKQMEAAEKAQLSKMEPFKDNPQLADKLWSRMYAFISERLSWDKLKPDMIKLYADNFTEEELAATLNFYKSPAGHAVLQKMPIVMNGALAITQQRMIDLMPEIQKLITESIQNDDTSNTSKKPEN